MSKHARNEKRKLLASFMGGISMVVLTYSAILPIIQIGLAWATWATIGIGMSVGLGLHLAGRRALQGLEEDAS